jgi:hypothetical protein
VTATDGASEVVGIPDATLVNNGTEGGVQYLSLPQAVQHLLDKS